MKLTRYEWEIKGGRVGFFQGLDVLKPEKFDHIDEFLDRMLPCPPRWVYKKNPQAKAYFTEMGLKRLKYEINSIIEFVTGYGIMNAKSIKIETDTSKVGKIVYSDQYQVIALE
jgi:hypothetical protein